MSNDCPYKLLFDAMIIGAYDALFLPIQIVVQDHGEDGFTLRLFDGQDYRNARGLFDDLVLPTFKRTGGPFDHVNQARDAAKEKIRHHWRTMSNARFIKTYKLRQQSCLNYWSGSVSMARYRNRADTRRGGKERNENGQERALKSAV